MTNTTWRKSSATTDPVWLRLSNYVSSGDVWEEGSGDENAETWRPACIIYFRFCIEIPTVLKMEVHAVQERTLSI